MDTKALAELGKKSYAKFKTGKKAYAYLKLVRGTLDENTRDGSAFKLGIKLTIDLAGKALGTSLSSHPYFTYHKAHIEILAAALNATSVTEQAREAFANAAKRASEAQDLEQQVASLDAMRVQLRFGFLFVHGGLVTLKEAAAGQTAALKASGMTESEMRTRIASDLYTYRCSWAGLADQALSLYVMARAEAEGVVAAMDRYDAKLAALKSGKTGGNIGRIAGYSLEQEQMWAEFDAMTKPSKTSRASYDPRGAARRSIESVESIVTKITTITDALFDDDMAYNRPEKLAEILSAP